MFSTQQDAIKPAVLFLSLAMGLCIAVEAQTTGGPGLSSGSGQGTGAGGRTGVLRNQSGSMSGVGPGSSSGSGLGGRVRPPPGSAQRELAPFGPGVDVTFPNDPYLIPFMALEQLGTPTDKNAPIVVTPEVLANARLIASAEERSLALQRIAKGAILSGQLTLAHNTLEEATTTASEVKVSLVRNQRLIEIINSLTALTEAYLREGDPLNPSYPMATTARPEALPKRVDSKLMIRVARLDWQRAVYLAEMIGNPTYRNEALYKVAESEASGSATIANQHINPPESDSPPSERPGAPATPKDGATPPKPQDQTQERLADNETYKKLADSILVDSFEVAKKIDRLIWKYRSMVRIVLLAADSARSERGFELAQQIKYGESRAEAMLVLAESQGRHHMNQAATASYEQAAQAVGMVHQEGLRGVLAGFLVDSLIARDRFEDARACVVLFPEQSQRLVALGLVAEAQGRNGTAESARRWIASEVPEEFRPTLYRRVTTGVLWAIAENRGKQYPDSKLPLP